jgi:hypothetical protein
MASTDPPDTPRDYDVEADDLGFYFQDTQYASRASPIGTKGSVERHDEYDVGIVESPFEIAYGFDIDAELEPDDLAINFATTVPYLNRFRGTTILLEEASHVPKRPPGLDFILHPPPRSLYGKLFFYSPALEHQPELDVIEEDWEEMNMAAKRSTFELEKIETEDSMSVGEEPQLSSSPPPASLTPSPPTLPATDPITVQPTPSAPPAGPVEREPDPQSLIVRGGPGSTLFHQLFGFCFPAWVAS